MASFKKLLLLAACLSTGEATATKTIFGVVSGSANHSNLAQSVTNNELTAALEAAGPITVFAPDNMALKTPLTKSAAHTAALTYHVLKGKFTSTAINKPCVIVATEQGKKVKIMKSTAGIVTLQDGTATATVISADLAATNGVVHSIDKVLTVPTDDSGLACPAADAASGAELPKMSTAVFSLLGFFLLQRAQQN